MLKLLFLPIGLLTVSLVTTFIVLLRIKNHLYHKIAISITAFIYIIFFTPFGANLLVGMLERPIDLPQNCIPGAKPVTVVVLAGGLSYYPSHTNDFSTLSKSSMDRVVRGIAFASNLQDSFVIIAGGEGWPDKESDIMRAFAIQLGFPEIRITTESRSRTTYENAKFVSQLLKSRGTDLVWLVTSSMHIPRAKASFRRFGISVCPHAVESEHRSASFPGTLIPQISALNKSTKAVHEIFGYVWYKITGRA